MTDKEFDILDELYFVKSFNDLSKEINTTDASLTKELSNLLEKEWIRILDENDNEITLPDIFKEDNLSSYKFIATKKGLIAHNQV